MPADDPMRNQKPFPSISSKTEGTQDDAAVAVVSSRVIFPHAWSRKHYPQILKVVVSGCRGGSPAASDPNRKDSFLRSCKDRSMAVASHADAAVETPNQEKRGPSLAHRISSLSTDQTLKPATHE